MLPYPNIDPVAVHLGPLEIHWYGITYAIGFAAAWWLGRIRARDPVRGWKPAEMDDLIFFLAIGVVLGGRFGYILFYKPLYYLHSPLAVFNVGEGGMSFHGGLIGVVAAMWWYGRRRGRGFFRVADFVAPLVPPGLAAGRIGNFINGELWGGPTDLPWAMVFPHADELPRHPSQLYQALLEGVALFVILWIYSRKPRPVMAVSGLFLAGYGVFRFLVELVRVPDAHIGYLAFGWVTMGQVLTLPMIVAGAGLFWYAYRSHPRTPVPAPDTRAA